MLIIVHVVDLCKEYATHSKSILKFGWKLIQAARIKESAILEFQNTTKIRQNEVFSANAGIASKDARQRLNALCRERYHLLLY